MTSLKIILENKKYLKPETMYFKKALNKFQPIIILISNVGVLLWKINNSQEVFKPIFKAIVEPVPL